MSSARPVVSWLRPALYVALAGCASLDNAATSGDPTGPRVAPALDPAAVSQVLPDPPAAPGEFPVACGACALSCGAEQRCFEATCAPRSDGVPRLLAPQSFGRVTSQRPTFRWVLPARVQGAQLQICHDRPCREVLESVDLVGQSLRLDHPLAPGVYFWRVRARRGTFLSDKPTPVWEFSVGARDAGIDTVQGRITDLDGDGYADVTLRPDSGRPVGVYLGGPQGTAVAPAALVTPPGGGSMNVAGDLDGDGFLDALTMEAPGGDPRLRTLRRYRSGLTGLTSEPEALALPSGVDHWPDRLVGVGDLNDDGYGDLLGVDPEQDEVPSVLRVFFGAPMGLQAAPGPLLQGEAGSRLGASVSGYGDVNGDGRTDLLIGAPSGEHRGRAYVWVNRPDGCLAFQVTTLWGDDALGSLFGAALSVVGDFNGDGYADPLVTEPYDATIVAHSHLLMFQGSAAGVAAAPVRTMPLQGASTEGIRLGAGGDFNGDGYGDLAAWMHNESRGPSIHLFYGAPAGLPDVASRIIYASDLGVTASALSFAWAGDTDRDGYDDLVLGLLPTQWTVLRGGAAGLGVVAGPLLDLP